MATTNTNLSFFIWSVA